jgi:hypothetical protein
MTLVTSRRDPDARGYFGEFGGRYVPETLVEPIEELGTAYSRRRVAFSEGRAEPAVTPLRRARDAQMKRSGSPGGRRRAIS